MLKRVFGIALVVFLVSGCINRDEIYANPPAELTDYVNEILPSAEQFVSENEREALDKGIELNASQMEMAQRVGLQHPEKVRLYYVDRLPFPEDPELVHISEHSDQSFRDYPITHFGLNRSLIPRLSDHF